MEQIVGISLSPTIDYSQTWEIVSREINDAVTCHYIIQIQDQYKQFIVTVIKKQHLGTSAKHKDASSLPSKCHKETFYCLGLN